MTAAPPRPADLPDDSSADHVRASGMVAPAAMARAANRPAAAVLGGAVILALALRLWGIGWQLPWQFHPDEGHYTWKAMDLISQETLNPKYFRNPSFFTYILLAEYKLFGFLPPRLDADAATLDGLFRPPTGVAFLGRVTSAIMGALTVAAIGWIGWRALGPWTGALGALFLAVAFIHVRDSHYATNDAPSVFLLTLSVAASVSLLRRPKLTTYLLAGLLGGLATSTKYNAGLFVAPLLVAHGVVVWRAWRGGRRPALVGAVVLPLALAGVVSLAAYLAGTPYTVLDFQKWRADFLTQGSFVDESWEGQIRMAPGLPYLLALGAGLGWPMLLLSIIGVVVTAKKSRAVAAVIAAFPVAYLLFMLRSELFFVRFALPAAPFLCLFAGAAVVAVVGRMRRHGHAPAVASGVLLTLLAAGPTTFDSVRHNLLIGQEDTRILAERWALANVPPTAKMQLEEYTIRDRRPRAYGAGVWQLDTDQFNVNTVRRADPAAPLRGSTRYFMVSSFQQDRFGVQPGSAQQQFYEALAREGRVVARFAPGHGGASVPFDLEDLYSPFWSLDRYERPGPTITVYELPGR